MTQAHDSLLGELVVLLTGCQPLLLEPHSSTTNRLHQIAGCTSTSCHPPGIGKDCYHAEATDPDASRAHAVSGSLPSRIEESWISRMAEASTMFLTMKRLMALSLATNTPDASQRTRLTCTALFSIRTLHEAGLTT